MAKKKRQSDPEFKEKCRQAYKIKRGVLLKDCSETDLTVARDYALDVTGRDPRHPADCDARVYVKYASPIQLDTLGFLLPHAKVLLPLPFVHHQQNPGDTPVDGREIFVFDGEFLICMLEFLTGDNADKYYAFVTRPVDKWKYWSPRKPVSDQAPESGVGG